MCSRCCVCIDAMTLLLDTNAHLFCATRTLHTLEPKGMTLKGFRRTLIPRICLDSRGALAHRLFAMSLQARDSSGYRGFLVWIMELP